MIISPLDPPLDWSDEELSKKYSTIKSEKRIAHGLSLTYHCEETNGTTESHFETPIGETIDQISKIKWHPTKQMQFKPKTKIYVDIQTKNEHEQRQASNQTSKQGWFDTGSRWKRKNDGHRQVSTDLCSLDRDYKSKQTLI